MLFFVVVVKETFLSINLKGNIYISIHQRNKYTFKNFDTFISLWNKMFWVDPFVCRNGAAIIKYFKVRQFFFSWSYFRKSDLFAEGIL